MRASDAHNKNAHHRWAFLIDAGVESACARLEGCTWSASGFAIAADLAGPTTLGGLARGTTSRFGESGSPFALALEALGLVTKTFVATSETVVAALEAVLASLETFLATLLESVVTALETVIPLLETLALASKTIASRLA